MRACFADAFYFLALVNRHDQAHAKALAASQELAGRHVVTTQWVLTEVGDALAAPRFRGAFATLLAPSESDPTVDIVVSNQQLWQEGVDLYNHRPDKSWSLTDCISFAVMRQRGITDALTGDRHFEQAGFNALLA
jgi:uncharacterized protein